ncbi:c-type cytochrome [Acidisoma cellulosilytica]|uniref:C-type cytochrome n=1 Tax=Acidisoma cellulosilyticum TaxID=2802395 RepID=A0A964E764_9PROT|nr:cytochrome c [Acidisoma cellulosilyticum]MCB8883683.1 c-type cytochrome [Acidisoma cellulosilyticum]
MRRLVLALLLSLAAPLAARAASTSDLVQRGEYLTRAADCAACHTAPGGTTYAGGRQFQLPFGDLYSPNITPDKETGIGQYTDAQFIRVLHRGIGREGQHLYPAMPYPSYTKMSDEDALAIKAYLFSLPPVHAPTKPNNFGFPFNQRWLMVFWNLINNPDSRLQSDPSKSAAWNRGAYLVEALGHCAECHTPRNFMQAKSSRQFAGTIQAGWFAYNLTSDPVHGIGAWSDASLEEFLSTGKAPGHGLASGPMAEAIEYSLRYMTPDDIAAMVTYLRTIPARDDGPAIVPATVTPLSTASLGEHIFIRACAGCHLPNGTGRQSPWAALGGDHSTGDVTGTNVVQVLTNGSQIETNEGLMFMHPFTGAYTDDELAAVGNYVIGQFSGRQGQVTPQQISKARQETAPKAGPASGGGS